MPNLKSRNWKEYLRFNRERQLKNVYEIGDPKHSIIEIVNHALRLFRDHKYDNTRDSCRRDAAMYDLSQIGRLLEGKTCD